MPVRGFRGRSPGRKCPQRRFDARTLAYVQARSEVVARLISLKKLPPDTDLGVDGIVTDDAGLLYSWQDNLADG